MKIKKILTKNAIEFEDITSIDDGKAVEYTNFSADGWAWRDYFEYLKLDPAYGCTAVMKNVGGKMLMSRNMDYILNNKTECVFKINAKDRFKSINVTNYSMKMSEDFDDLVKKGEIPDEKAGLLAYFTLDGINEKGLVIEINMRPSEYKADGVTPIILSDGTNPGKLRVPVSTIPRIVLDRCSTIEELLKLIGAVDSTTGKKYGDGEFDFYTILSEECNWILSFSIMDETGRYGVLEPIDNKMVWIENAKGQANFFVYEEAEKIEKYGSGYGRWDYVMDKYDSIKNEDEFFELTKKISYSLVESNSANWDVSTESTHSDVFASISLFKAYAEKNGIKVPSTEKLKQSITTKDGKDIVITLDNFKDYEPEIRSAKWTKDFVQKDETGEVKAKIEWVAEFYKSLTEKQRRELNIFWNTAHHELYNATDKTLRVEFWETGEVFNYSL